MSTIDSTSVPIAWSTLLARNPSLASWGAIGHDRRQRGPRLVATLGIRDSPAPRGDQ
jgi:hypothetical protein